MGDLVKMRKGIIIFSLFFFSLFALYASADMVKLKNGETVKGLILDEYKDRIVLSTASGERVLMKGDISSAVYDSEERTLLRKADNLFKKGQYIKAYYAYAGIVELNPEQEEARQRLNYLRNYIEDKTHDKFRGKSAKRIYHGEDATQGSSLEKLRDTYGVVLVQKENDVYVGQMTKILKDRYFKALKPGDKIVNVWGEMSAYMDAREVAALMMNSDQVDMEIERSLDPKLTYAGSLLSKLFFGYRRVIGAKLVLRRDGIKIYGLVKSGPFFVSGVEKGDLLYRIAGESTRYMPMERVVEIIMASQGKDLDIVIHRKLIFWKKG